MQLTRGTVIRITTCNRNRSHIRDRVLRVNNAYAGVPRSIQQVRYRKESSSNRSPLGRVRVFLPSFCSTGFASASLTKGLALHTVRLTTLTSESSEGYLGTSDRSDYSTSLLSIKDSWVSIFHRSLVLSSYTEASDYNEQYSFV